MGVSEGYIQPLGEDTEGQKREEDLVVELNVLVQNLPGCALRKKADLGVR